MALNEKERITLLMMRGYGDMIRSYDQIRHLFNDEFPNRPPISKTVVRNTIKRFEETGSVKDRPRAGRPSALEDNQKLNILQSFTEDPKKSIREVAIHFDLNKNSVHRVLTSNHFTPFKIQIKQELSEDDFDRRIEFTENMMNRAILDDQFLKRIVFSDEATFMLNGTVNRHNSRYWSDENPHWMFEGHTQHPKKVNVWAGMIDSQIIGPFLIEGNLTAEKYLEMLQNQIIPAIRNLVGNDFINIWFQHDGAPPHYGRVVRAFLNYTFPGRWIGRRGEVEWPARSPDLSPLDFFFWGYIKNRIYATKPADENELWQRIVETSAAVGGDMLSNATTNGFYHRLAYCQDMQGKHFENLI